MTPERRYDIDWLRVIAIGLLLVYHIAIIFQPWALMVGFIGAEEPLEAIWKPMTLLNVWRIPLLFYVSGMGVCFAIRKRNWVQLLRERGRRILLPFVFGFLAIAPLHFLVFQKYYGLPAGYYPHAGHLWFLGNIFVYVLLLSPVFFLLKKHAGGALMQKITAIMRNPLGPLSVTLFFVAEVLLVRPRLFELYAETWHGFFIGLLAFFFGFLFVLSGKEFWQTVRKWRWCYIGLGAVLYGVRFFLFDLSAPGYLLAIESNGWILGIFGLGYKYLNRPGAALRYLSQAAYPVYIIHMFVLYGGAALILPLDLSPMAKFLAITAFTGIGCMLIYEFILRRIGLLRPLFGMKGSYKGKDSRQLLPEAVKRNE